MNTFWKKVKSLRKCIISSIVSKGLESRSYANLTIFDKNYFALLDSVANTSCIGGELSQFILNDSTFSYIRFSRNVRTADGKVQPVMGSISLSISFNNKSNDVTFLIIPSIKHDIICGMDFWKFFKFLCLLVLK